MIDMKKFYSAYYMMTARCNLSCSYCVLENLPFQISRELSIDKKKKLILHLYKNYNVRSLTISGGEPICIGGNLGKDFISLMHFLKEFKHENKEDNLIVKMYSNGLLMTEEIVSSMKGVVDRVSINIDSCNDALLRRIGRLSSYNGGYFQKAIDSIRLLYANNIKIKLHTVISALNYDRIAQESKKIYEEVAQANPLLDNWKFYQYMSYDDPIKDKKHEISIDTFNSTCSEISETLKNYQIKLKFKSKDEMNESLFNILATGIAQFRRDNDTWTTTKRTKSLFDYKSIDEMLKQNEININLFQKYHSYNP